MGAGFKAWEGREGLLLLRSDMFAAEGFIAAFTTRKGGWSPPPFDCLNMGFGVPDDPGNVTANRKLVLGQLGLDLKMATSMRQVHGVSVVEVSAETAGCGGLSPEGAFKDTDAMFTRIPGVSLLATFADCVPVIIADRGKGSIGVAHAGWRGTVSGCSIELALRMGFDKSRASDFMAAIGPSIGPCCYEVGKEVAVAITGSIGCDPAVKHENGSFFADLGLANELQLTNMGFIGSRIERYMGCTSCEKELFFSHRRDKGRTGRCAAIVASAGI